MPGQFWETVDGYILRWKTRRLIKTLDRLQEQVANKAATEFKKRLLGDRLIRSSRRTALLETLGHAALGGLAVAAAMTFAPNVPPLIAGAIGSAFSSVVSAYCKPPA